MRILHVANFSWFLSRRKRADNLARHYAPDRKISNGLIRNGHCVWDFSYRDAARHYAPPFFGKKFGAAKMRAHLLKLARQFAPDLILLGHCELLRPETLAALRDSLPGCKIAQWWVDWLAEHSLPHLRAKQPFLDAFFATSAPGYCRARIGGASSPPFYYFPNIVDSSAETARAFAAERHDYDLFFAGADAPEREKLLADIAALPDVRLGFFGFGGRPKLNGADFAATIGASKIGLNFSRAADVPLYSSDRLAQLTGNGCLALTPKTPGMTALYAENEVAYYDDGESPAAAAARHLADDIAWRKTAEAGWRRAHASYNEKRVMRFVADAAMGREFAERYEWIGEEAAA